VEQYLYLFLNLATISIPLVCSFDRRLQFYKKWKELLLAFTITALFFLIWDQIFTAQGVWGFNEKYIMGLKFGELPLEEILFFFCIPYACVFTYEAFGILFKKSFAGGWVKWLVVSLSLTLLALAIISKNQIYTLITFLLTPPLLWIALPLLGANKLGRFFFSYLILLLPFLLVNGVLTGSWITDEVVWYNNAEHLGFRIGTIPITDTVYMLLLLLMNVVLFEVFKKRRN